MYVYMCVCIFYGSTAPSGPRLPHCPGFTITLRHTTRGRTPLGEWPACSRDLYVTKHNRQKSTPPAEFEPAIPATERPQTHTLDCAATQTGKEHYITELIKCKINSGVRWGTILTFLTSRTRRWCSFGLPTFRTA